MSELLVNVVKHYSPSYHESGAVQCLTEWMNSHGFKAWVDEAGNACGMRGDENAPNLLVLLGHIDTYAGEIPVRIEDGVLYGRGSVDAKGSLCAFAEAAASATLPANWRLLVVGAVGEECPTSKGARHIAPLYQPQLCIIGEPSGARRITLGYKGRLIADCTLSRPMSHSASAAPSAGAVGAELWGRVVAWANRANQAYPRLFDKLLPHLNSINTTHDHFTETVRLSIGFRLPPHISPEQAEAHMRLLAQDETWAMQFYSAEHAYQTDKQNGLVRGMLSAIRAHGHKPDYVLKTGTSDMNVVGQVWTCPIIAYGAGDSNLDHTPNEHLPLEEYQLAIQILRTFIEQLV